MDTNTHTGRTPCEHEGRDQGEVPMSQGRPKIARKPPKLEDRPRTTSLPTDLRRNQPYQCLDFELPASTTVRECVLLLCYCRQPLQTGHPWLPALGHGQDAGGLWAPPFVTSNSWANQILPLGNLALDLRDPGLGGVTAPGGPLPQTPLQAPAISLVSPLPKA